MASHRGAAARSRSARMSWSSSPVPRSTRPESVGFELRQQGRPVGVADLPRHQDSIGGGELVARGQDADRRARAYEQRRDTEAREYPDVGGCEPGPWREDLGARGDVLARFPYVRARAHRFLDEHGQCAILRPRALHHAHCVGTGRHQRTGHYPHCLAVRNRGLRPVAGRRGAGHPQADRGGSHIGGLYGIPVHSGISEAGHGLGGVHRLGRDVPKRVADGHTAWRERRDRGQDETTRLGYRDQCRHPYRFRGRAAVSAGHKVPADWSNRSAPPPQPPPRVSVLAAVRGSGTPDSQDHN